MKNIVFLCYVVPPDDSKKYGGISIAGNKMQWNLVKYLSQKDDVSIHCITITPRALYPREKVAYQKKEKFSLLPGVTSYHVPYLNLPVIKQVWQIISVHRAAKKIIISKKADTLLCFNLFPQVGIPMRWLKKQFPKLDTVCLLADLPIDDKTNRKGVSKWLRLLFDRSTWKSMKNCDRYIVLNENVMKKYLPEKTYLVVDGGIDDEMITHYSGEAERKGEKNILYCGSLAEYSGVRNLLQAMEYVPMEDIYLDIYGSGFLESEVKKASEKDGRIRFHGRVDNQEMLKLQRKAWVLINPRSPSDPIAQVTFPSKTFEYLLSGTPVISTRLNGYGTEYDDHILFTNDSSPKSIADKIIEVAKMDQETLKTIGNNAQKFVIEEKSWSQQAGRIHLFLEQHDYYSHG